MKTLNPQQPPGLTLGAKARTSPWLLASLLYLPITTLAQTHIWNGGNGSWYRASTFGSPSQWRGGEPQFNSRVLIDGGRGINSRVQYTPGFSDPSGITLASLSISTGDELVIAARSGLTRILIRDSRGLRNNGRIQLGSGGITDGSAFGTGELRLLSSSFLTGEYHLSSQFGGAPLLQLDGANNSLLSTARISGGGVVSANSLNAVRFRNAGVIEADDPLRPLVLDFRGPALSLFSNSSVLRASGAAGLSLHGRFLNQEPVGALGLGGRIFIEADSQVRARDAVIEGNVIDGSGQLIIDGNVTLRDIRVDVPTDVRSFDRLSYEGEVVINDPLTSRGDVFVRAGAQLSGRAALQLQHIFGLELQLTGSAEAPTVGAGQTTTSALTVSGSGLFGSETPVSGLTFINNGQIFGGDSRTLRVGVAEGSMINNGVLEAVQGPGIELLGDLENRGSLRVAAPLQAGADVHFQQTAGQTELAGGTFTAAEVLMFNGGSIVGSGTFDAALQLTDTLLAPGNSPGIVNITGPFVMNSGSIDLELAGLLVDGAAQQAGQVNVATSTIDFDQINVFDSATIADGVTINIDAISGFVPSDGDFFDVFTADNLAIDLSQVLFQSTAALSISAEVLRLPDNTSGGTLRDVLRLFVSSAATSVPLPTTWLMVLLGLLAVRRSRA